MAAPARADETGLRDPHLLEELVSTEGDSEGSESEDSEVEPERGTLFCALQAAS